jgi:hypothetical protein
MAIKNRIQATPGELTGWFLPVDSVSDIQRERITEFVRRAKGAHFINILMRIDGQDENIEADWLSRLDPSTSIV